MTCDLEDFSGDNTVAVWSEFDVASGSVELHLIGVVENPVSHVEVSVADVTQSPVPRLFRTNIMVCSMVKNIRSQEMGRQVDYMCFRWKYSY